jgi:hypothetical protein
MTRAKHTTPADTTAAVDAFMTALDHPQRATVAALRALILAADPNIAEGVKWNAPSFRTADYFATVNLRQKGGAQLILHLGAKVRQTATTGIDVADPTGLLTWLAKDRAAVTVTGEDDLAARGPALTALVREWLRWV